MCCTKVASFDKSAEKKMITVVYLLTYSMYVLDICSTLAQCVKWITKPSQKFADFSVPRIQWDPCNRAIAIVVTMVKKFFFPTYFFVFTRSHGYYYSAKFKSNQDKSRKVKIAAS